MKNFRKKWFISASSGIFGKIALVLLCLGAGVVGGQYLSVPIDKDIIIGAGVFIGLIALLFTVLIFTEFPLILEWFTHKRASENEKIQLENEKIQLENENLRLKLELQEKQSQRENDE